MAFARKSNLPRLPRDYYRGRAFVLWTHTIEHRATGWLDDRFHHLFREVLLHAGHRHALVSPCYVLMPDHWHIVWMGLAEVADQWLGTGFLRKHLQSALGLIRLQDRAHDHVLRDTERERGAFQAACDYVCRNPERAGLCTAWREWPYLGALVPGYPDLDPRQETFWEKFWKIHNRLIEPSSIPALTRRATTSNSHLSRGPLREERDGLPCRSDHPSSP